MTFNDIVERLGRISSFSDVLSDDDYKLAVDNALLYLNSVGGLLVEGPYSTLKAAYPDLQVLRALPEAGGTVPPAEDWFVDQYYQPDPPGSEPLVVGDAWVKALVPFTLDNVDKDPFWFAVFWDYLQSEFYTILYGKLLASRGLQGLDVPLAELNELATRYREAAERRLNESLVIKAV